jgi:hypothetical protein
MIARDVETCLKAELNLDVDYRKIGVVIIDPMKETDPVKRSAAAEIHDVGAETDVIVDKRLSEIPTIDAGAAAAPAETRIRDAGSDDVPGGGRPLSPMEDPAVPPDVGAPYLEPPAGVSATLEFLEEDMRIRFAGLRLSIEETRVDAEVKLEKNGLEVVGCLGGFRTGGSFYKVVAGAAIHAITELLDERFHLCLSTVKEVEVSGSSALLAVVDCIDGRVVRRFAGCVFVGRDPNEAAVLAVLDALNRPSGRWKSRTEIHYRIR